MYSGEHLAVVGPSGADKSSLIAILAGWIVPSIGTIHVDGSSLDGSALGRLRRVTAWADGSTRLHDASLATNADFGAHSDASPAPERLRFVGLSAAHERFGDEPIGTGGARLSNTEAQRLRLARALGRPNARLVLLDEALGGLPLDELRPLVARCREIWHSATLVHVTHDVASTTDFERVIVIDRGRIVEDGDPAALAANARSHYAALLGSQAKLQARTAARRATGDETIRLPTATDAPSRGVLRGLFTGRATVVPFALALLAGLIAALALVLAGDRLGAAVRQPDAHELGWFNGVTALLVVAAAATGAGAYLLGKAAVGFGRALRHRALAAAAATRLSTTSVGERIARVLDLEQLEATALGAGALVGFAFLEAIVASALLVSIGQPLAASLLAVALLAALAFARALERRGEEATAARAAATSHLIERLIALRTVTLQEDPAAERSERLRILDAVERAHARVDRGRVALMAVLPRAGGLLMLGAVALDPPAQPTTAAGVLGAILLGLGALELLGSGLAQLAPGAAAIRAARSLLVAPATGRSTSRLRSPEARAEHVLHQPLAANALLGGRCWPPSPKQIDELTARLRSVGLSALVERMPLGLGQPLGETGWRLSAGERARLMLVRALMTDADEIILENPLAALDPESATVALDAMDADNRAITITGS